MIRTLDDLNLSGVGGNNNGVLTVTKGRRFKYCGVTCLFLLMYELSI